MEFLYTLISITCLIFGFYSGYTIGKEQSITKVTEAVSPSKIIERHKEEKENKEIEEETKEKLKELEEDLNAIDEYNADI